MPSGRIHNDADAIAPGLWTVVVLFLLLKRIIEHAHGYAYDKHSQGQSAKEHLSVES